MPDAESPSEHPGSGYIGNNGGRHRVPLADQGTPRWVHVFAAIALLLIIMFVIWHLVSGGLGQHMHG